MAKIPKATRKKIFDGLRINKIDWSGLLDEPAFLERLFDLDSLPSTDGRFTSAAGDIWQHRVNNWDWDDYWIFEDRRFALLECEENKFLEFLCEIVHPVVREKEDEASEIVGQFNHQLKLCGWEIVSTEKIGGRDVYEAKTLSVFGSRSVSRAKTVANILDADWMRGEVGRMEEAADKDPALAIGTAKDLIETCCKTILAGRGVEVTKSMDLPQITKLVAKELNLIPDDVSDRRRGANSIKLILQNLSAISQHIAELRGLYGSGHGRHGSHRGLQPRHARLAVGAAVTFVEFIVETYRADKI